MPLTTVDMDSSAAPASDSVLLARFLDRRDEQAFRELVGRHASLVMSVAWRVMQDRHAAEDVFQAVFLVLAQRARTIRSGGSLAAWLHGVTLRVARKALARRRRVRESPMTRETSAAPEFDRLAQYEEQAALDEELARLPEIYRAPLILFYLQGKSCPEIAAELGVSAAAIDGRLKRGRGELQWRLARRGFGLSVVVLAAQTAAPHVHAAVTEALVASTAEACLSSAIGAALPPVLSPEASHLALRELNTMATASLVKSTLICGGVLLSTVAAGAWGLGAGGPGRTGAGLTPVAANASPGDDDPGENLQSAAGPVLLAAADDQAAGQGGALGTGGAGAGAGTGDPSFGGSAGGGFGGDAASGGLGGLAGDGFGDGAASGAGLGEPGGGGMEMAPAGMAPGMGGGGMAGMMMGSLSGGSEGPMDPGAPGIVDFQRHSPIVDEIHRKLQEPANFDVQESPFRDALDFLATDHQIAIALDDRALNDAEIDPDALVSLVVSDVRLESVLRRLLRNVPGGPLEYIVQDEVLLITTPEAARAAIETRVYDVSQIKSVKSDALASVIMNTVEPSSWGMARAGGFPGMSRSARAANLRAYAAEMMNGTMGGAASGYPGALFAGQGGEQPSGSGLENPERSEHSDCWIEPLPMALVVRASQPVHRDVVDLLEQMLRLSVAQQQAERASETAGGSPYGGGGIPGFGGESGYPGGPGEGLSPGGNVSYPGMGDIPGTGGQPGMSGRGGRRSGGIGPRSGQGRAGGRSPGGTPGGDPLGGGLSGAEGGYPGGGGSSGEAGGYPGGGGFSGASSGEAGSTDGAGPTDDDAPGEGSRIRT